MSGQPTLFDGSRLTMDDALALTVESLRKWGANHSRWGIAWSGGKDSTSVLTLVVHLIESGQIPRPRSLHVLFADTRMELTPLMVAAADIIAGLRSRGIDVRTVMAPLDRRFLVYILGRGVPPPNNNTFRWCTRQIKVEPMLAEVRRLSSEYDADGRESKVLMLTGVRQGESAIRDKRIAMSCGRDGAECGQGWYQQTLPGSLCDTLAPLLHWRVCHVWDWLRIFAPAAEYGGWATAELAEAYGGDEATEINARTGCVGCPLAHQDTALDTILKHERWAYLAPLKELRPIYRRLRERRNRLRKPGGETRQDGSLVANQHRMGPLTFKALLLSKRPEGWRVRLEEALRWSCSTARPEDVWPWKIPNTVGLSSRWLAGTPPPNVWALTSVNDQASADKHNPQLLQIPARVHGVSYEPATGPVDFRFPAVTRRTKPPGFDELPESRKDEVINMAARAEYIARTQMLDWVIVGGESGPHSRPFDVAWARSTIDQCKAAGVACFVKQLGKHPVVTDGSAPRHVFESLRDPKGGSMEEWPADLRIREFPEGPRA